MARNLSIPSMPPAERIVSTNLFSSDFYQLKHWLYDFERIDSGATGFNDCLCIVFLRRGNFSFDLAKDRHTMYSSHIIIDKPNYEYRLRPSIGECSIFNFTEDFYRQFLEDMNMKQSFFFSNPNILSLLLQASPEAGYLHHQLIKRIGTAGKLEMDNLVLEFFNQIVGIITNTSVEEEMNAILRMDRQATVELAKEYLHENFASDISLVELSGHCYISPFHFSRLFKKFTSFSPHQYLLNIRLKHGEMLLKNSLMPVSEIAFAAGFNSVEHFATAFKQKYLISPTNYRK